MEALVRFASHISTSIMLNFYTKWVPLKASNASYWQVWIPSRYHLCMKNNWVPPCSISIRMQASSHIEHWAFFALSPICNIPSVLLSHWFKLVDDHDKLFIQIAFDQSNHFLVHCSVEIRSNETSSKWLSRLQVGLQPTQRSK